MTRQWDVVIVGARVAGAASALLLARAGLRVLCIDRSRYGSDTISTHALMRGGVLQLHSWGLLDELVAAGTPRVRRTVFHYGDERVAVSIKSANGVDSLFAPRRTVLDPILVDDATRSGAVFRFGAHVIGMHRDRSGAIAGVVVRDSHSRRTWIEHAPLVIGADGRNSAVALAVAAPRTASGRHASSFLYSYWAGLATDGYEWFYRPGLAAGAIPTNGGLACVFLSTAPAALDRRMRSETGPAVFARLAGAAGLAPRLADAERVESVRFVRGLPAAYLRAAHGPGWALVGDAGHWLDPMSTHGMTAALRDAALLAQAVVSAPPRTAELDDAMAGYETARDALSIPMIGASDEIAGYAWDLERVRVVLRNLSSAMTDEVEVLDQIARNTNRERRGDAERKGA